MIWLIGNRGMLGSDVEKLLVGTELKFFASDSDVDITSLETLESFTEDKSIDWIINCAAYTAVENAESNRDEACAINAKGPENIAKIAKNKNAKMIHISTDYVFDGKKDSAYLESDTTNPINIYGSSKLEGEKNIINIWPRYFIIRTSWLYGHNGNNFVKMMLGFFQKGADVSVVSDQFGSPTYSADLAKVIVNIVSKDPKEYGVYNFTNEGKISWSDFASEIQELALKHGLVDKKITVKSVPTSEYPSKITRPVNSHLSRDKIRQTFGVDVRNWKVALEEFIMEEEKS
jgi:dTDP-4-dehydrorhamnose reductase